MSRRCKRNPDMGTILLAVAALGGLYLYMTVIKPSMDRNQVIRDANVPWPKFENPNTPTVQPPTTTGCPYINGRRYVAYGDRNEWYQVIWGGQVIMTSSSQSDAQARYDQEVANSGCASGA